MRCDMGQIDRILRKRLTTRASTTRAKDLSVVLKGIPKCNSDFSLAITLCTLKMACPIKTKDERTFDAVIKDESDIEIRKFLDYLEKDVDQLISHAAWRRDPRTDFRITMREVNDDIRANYKVFMKHVGENIFPVVFASDSDPGQVGTGTTWTVYERNGSIRRYYETNEDYEFYKGLSHQLLGLFTYVAPYLHSPNSIAWINPLKGFQSKVQAARYLVEPTNHGHATRKHKEETDDFSSTRSKLSAEQAEDAYFLLKIVDDYITTVTERKSLDLDEFKALSQKMMPSIEKNMREAVKLQVDAYLSTLAKIKKQLGKEWKDTYVLVPTVWPVSGVNPRMQALEKFMEVNHFRSHVISAMNHSTYEEALVTLGRIVGDRAMAQVAFGNATDDMRKHIYAISSPQDLMADFMDDELRKREDKDSLGGKRKHSSMVEGRNYQQFF